MALLKKEGAKVVSGPQPVKVHTTIQKKVKVKFDKAQKEKGKPLTDNEKEEIAFGVMMEEEMKLSSKRITGKEAQKLTDKILKAASK